jgi:hypothetical protein
MSDTLQPATPAAQAWPTRLGAVECRHHEYDISDAGGIAIVARICAAADRAEEWSNGLTSALNAGRGDRLVIGSSPMPFGCW